MKAQLAVLGIIRPRLQSWKRYASRSKKGIGWHPGTAVIGTGGTEQSTGTGTDSGFVFTSSRYTLVTLEALVQYSFQLRDAGALENI
jgi:hypothetical protein